MAASLHKLYVVRFNIWRKLHSQDKKAKIPKYICSWKTFYFLYISNIRRTFFIMGWFSTQVDSSYYQWHEKNSKKLPKEVINCSGPAIYPVDTERKLNVHKTFRGRPGRLLNVLCTFNLRPVSAEIHSAKHSQKLILLRAKNMVQNKPQYKKC